MTFSWRVSVYDCLLRINDNFIPAENALLGLLLKSLSVSSSVKSQDLILAGSPRDSHGRLACYASQGNGCSMGCALSTAARFKNARSGSIPTSGGTARQERSSLLILEGFCLHKRVHMYKGSCQVFVSIVCQLRLIIL